MEIIPIVKQIKNAIQFSCPIQAPLQSSIAPAANIKDNIPVIAKMLVISFFSLILIVEIFVIFTIFCF
jgi:hypothetical protein